MSDCIEFVCMYAYGISVSLCKFLCVQNMPETQQAVNVGASFGTLHM